jgi:hypothetical protein
MKKSICLAVFLFAAALAPAFGQSPGIPAPFGATARAQPPSLTRFALDFKGGAPGQLVSAIENATGKPLNAIIPVEDVDVQLPPLKMNDVVAPELFAALEAASRKVVAVSTSGNGSFGSYQQVSIDYGFKTADNPISDSSIWYFHAEKPGFPELISSKKTCRFYSLEPFLNRGFTVDDITTAIQTGWKMSGVSPLPELNYHKETRLLIAFGQPGELGTISEVLQTLPAHNTTVTEVGDLQGQIQHLQDQVDALTKKASTLASPDEKSGK